MNCQVRWNYFRSFLPLLAGAFAAITCFPTSAQTDAADVSNARLIAAGGNDTGFDSSSTVRTLPDEQFSENAWFFIHVNRPISKCSAKF